MFYARIALIPAILCCTVLLAGVVALAQPMRPPELPTPDSAQAGAEPGYLGMVADDRQENGGGVRVKDVDPDSPASKGGLQSDDLITAINGQAAHSLDDLRSIVGGLQAGTQVKFQIQRQGVTQEVNVTLGRRPPPDQRRFQSFGRIPDAPANQDEQSANGQNPADQSSPAGGIAAPRMGAGLSGAPRPLLGIRTLPVTPQDQMRLGLSSTAGAHVMARTLGSPAEKANIPLDSVITAVNGAPVGTPNDLTALLARAGAGNEVELTYFYNGKPASMKLTLASAATGMGMNNAQSAPSTLPQPPPPGQSMPLYNSQRQYGNQQGSVDIARPGDVSTGSNGTPPRPFDTQPHQTDAQRIDALERRVQELEQRVEQLESRQQHGT